MASKIKAERDRTAFAIMKTNDLCVAALVAFEREGAIRIGIQPSDRNNMACVFLTVGEAKALRRALSVSIRRAEELAKMEEENHGIEE